MEDDVRRIGWKCWRDVRDAFWVSVVLAGAFAVALVLAHPGAGGTPSATGGVTSGVAGVWTVGGTILFTASAILLSAGGTPAELSGEATPVTLGFPVSPTRWFAVHTGTVVVLLAGLAASVSLVLAALGLLLGLPGLPREVALAFPLLLTAVISGAGLTLGIMGWTGEVGRAPLWAGGLLLVLATGTLAGPLAGWSPIRVAVAGAVGAGVPWRPYLFLLLVGAGSFAAALAAPAVREG